MNFNLDYIGFLRFNCPSFENLIELKINFNLIAPNELDINEFIFIFDSKNPLKFNSLKILSLMECNYVPSYKTKDIEKFFLNKSFNKYMPNLEDFTLYCMRIYEQYYYIELYETIFLMNLKKIDMKLFYPFFAREIFSLKELKQLFPITNFDKYENVSIEKFIKEDDEK